MKGISNISLSTFIKGIRFSAIAIIMLWWFDRNNVMIT